MSIANKQTTNSQLPLLKVTAGQTYQDAVDASGLPVTGPSAIVVAKRDGQLLDLYVKAIEDGEFEPITLDSPDGLFVMRHSCAHVLAQAVQNSVENVALGIGPPIQDGFYYDFGVDIPFTPDDLKALERKMEAIIKSGQRFQRRELSSIEEAKSELSAQPYKLELVEQHGSSFDNEEAQQIMEVGEGSLTMYDNIDSSSEECVWTDLCRGPHLPTTRHIGAFKLLRSAAAYWRGSEKNPQLQRIYGTAWPTKADLKDYNVRLEEAAKRDHRKLGSELDLFSFPEEIGSGLPVFHEKGGTLRRIMEEHARRRHVEAGYSFVNTPHITKAQLFEKSGHLGWYKDGMFPPMHLEDGGDYYVKPMNCPMHNLIFGSRGRSYRELPLRYFEFGSVYRYEKSGVVHGLTRVRGMTQDDAHIYCTREQMRDEIASILRFVLSLLNDYGISDFFLELSTRDDSEKFIGDKADWDEATSSLAQVAQESGLELVADPGGAAFYGPKISVQARDAIGRTWQVSTIQLDFQLPKRFDLEYTAEDGNRKRVVMIHRALFGSIERFMGILVEHYAGAFPFWLSPVQVVGIPVADEHIDYLKKFESLVNQRGMRMDVDGSTDRMQKKIRNAQKQKVPVMVIVGERDVADETVSFRFRDGSQDNSVPIEQALSFLDQLNNSKSNVAPSATSS